MITAPAPKQAFLDIIPIDSITIGERFRKQFDGIEELAESIQAIGLLQPVGVTSDNQLVFGHRRLLALKHLGRATVAVKRVAGLNALQSEFDENECRANFTLSERVAIAEALRPKIEAAAAARVNQHSNSAGVKNTPADTGKSRDAIAAAVGLSAPKLAKATAVIAAAKSDPVKYAGVVEQMDGTGNASAAHAAITDSPAPKPVRHQSFKEIVATLALLDNADRYAIIDECSRLNGMAREIAA